MRFDTMPSNPMRQACSNTRPAVGIQVLVEPNGPGSASQEGCPSLLSVGELTAAPLLAFQLDQIEGEQHHVTVAASAAQRVEVGPAVGTADDRLPVQQEGVRTNCLGGLDNGREAVGPVIGRHG